MIYECAKCNKLYNEEEGIMFIAELPSFMGTKPIYVFKCRNCMTEKGGKKFDEFKKRNK